jgi:D-glycero-alpha-D-manno-heptose 1-phosphate guanylyltransferase
MSQLPDVVIFSGGLGLRLKGLIGDAPKPMARVNDRPFLDLLLSQLKRHGFSRIILSVGYKNEAISNYFGTNAFGLQILYSVESSPLGTGGALRYVSDLVTTQNVLVMNGDSYTDVDFGDLIQVHNESQVLATIVVVPEIRSDGGNVHVGEDRKILTFAEKRLVAKSEYLSAGIYLLNKNLVSTIPSGATVSLETEVFPEWLARGECMKAFIHMGKCIDIGTPERYLEAQDLLANVEYEARMRRRGVQR